MGQWLKGIFFLWKAATVWKIIMLLLLLVVVVDTTTTSHVELMLFWCFFFANISKINVSSWMYTFGGTWSNKNFSFPLKIYKLFLIQKKIFVVVVVMLFQMFVGVDVLHLCLVNNPISSICLFSYFVSKEYSALVSNVSMFMIYISTFIFKSACAWLHHYIIDIFSKVFFSAK